MACHYVNGVMCRDRASPCPEVVDKMTKSKITPNVMLGRSPIGRDRQDLEARHGISSRVTLRYDPTEPSCLVCQQSETGQWPVTTLTTLYVGTGHCPVRGMGLRVGGRQGWRFAPTRVCLIIPPSLHTRR